MLTKNSTLALLLSNAGLMLFAVAIPGYLYLLAIISLFLFFCSHAVYSSGLALGLLFMMTLALFLIAYHLQTTSLLYLVTVALFISNKTVLMKVRLSVNLDVILIALIVAALLVHKLLDNRSDGRFAGLFVDPNFAAYWLILATYTVQIISKYSNFRNTLPKHKALMYFSLLSVIVVLTQSRTALLAIIVFYLLTLLVHLSKFRTLKLMSYVIFLSSVFLQFALYVVFTEFLQIGNVQNANVLDRMININDTSNLARFTSAYLSFDLFINDGWSSILFGNFKLFVAMVDAGYNIPHNWFLQSLFVQGALFTLLLLFGVLKMIVNTPNELLPYFSSLLLFPALLSLVCLSALCLQLFLWWIIHNSRKEPKHAEM